MIIFTISLDPDPLLFSNPALIKQIISDPGGSGSGSTTLLKCKNFSVQALNLALLKYLKNSNLLKKDITIEQRTISYVYKKSAP
jgi:hypothetical protein